MDIVEKGESNVHGADSRERALKEWGDDVSPRPSLWHRRKTMIVGLVLTAVLLIGLGNGLGLGLGLKHKRDNGDAAVAATGNPSRDCSLWQPAVNSSWQIVLSYALDINSESPAVTPDVDIFDIDLFLHQNSTVIDSLHKLGKKVICYFSAGSYEPGRPDSSQFKDSDLGAGLDGWPGEFWLNINSASVRDIMAKRIELASRIGCDAVDPDNVDGFQNTNGLNLTAEDSVSFVKFLAAEASKRGLSTGLKNAADIIEDVLPVMQFAVNEECSQYEECETFAAFVEAGKPVFHIEYPPGAPDTVTADDIATACLAPGTSGFSTVLQTLDLEGWVEFCNGETAVTAVFKDD